MADKIVSRVSMGYVNGDLVLVGGYPSGTGVVGNVRVVDGNTGIGATLDIASITTEQTFTFPDASGTIALTANTPVISQGTLAPSSTPDKVGDIYVDTNNLKIYVATGNTSSGDWTVVN